MFRVRILVVGDDGIGAADLGDRLHRLGYVVSGISSNVEQALQMMASKSTDLVLIDIHLKGKIDTIDAARRIRDQFKIPVVYLSNSRDLEAFRRANLAQSFGYVLKPFDEQMIEINIEVALRHHAMAEESERLANKLNQALADVKTLNGLLPICSGCKKIQDQKGYWTRFEVYIEKHSAATFMHGICPDCRQELQTEVEGQIQGKANTRGISGPRL